MPHGIKTPDEELEIIHSMTDKGASNKEISDFVGRPQGTISIITTKYWNKKLEHLKI